ncbi:MepB family protein [Pedobacter cryotolerans]|nr:MepB family protein [Pedobacter cryotolerans]
MIEGILPKIIQLYDKCGVSFTEFNKQKESIEYDACTFKLNGKSVICRTAKITPTKIGQFVTVWKRSENGITIPFNINDNFDFFVITTLNGKLFGQFIFPKSVLLAKGVISGENSAGKRGIRVYPPWDLTTSKQAQKTQHWQLAYFVNFDDDYPALIKKLLK